MSAGFCGAIVVIQIQTALTTNSTKREGIIGPAAKKEQKKRTNNK